MKDKVNSSMILRSQAIGFLALIALSWIDESLGLRTLILGNHPYISDFRESTLEMLFVLAVWLLVCRSTRRVLAQNRELKSFLRVCSWCRRIGSEGRWMPMEEFFVRRFETPTSHGICEECLEKEQSMIAAEQKQLQLPAMETDALAEQTRTVC